jgi:3-oxoacyl-[acyl-carrier protein] reductase
VDILVNNAGGPPPAISATGTAPAWIKAVDANMLTPIELIKATVDGMAERGFGRVVNITSGAVKAPIDVLGLSNGARSGLTGFVAGLARQSRLAARNVTSTTCCPAPSTPTGCADDGGRSGQDRPQCRGTGRSAREGHPGAALRHGRRVRCGLRLLCSAQLRAT